MKTKNDNPSLHHTGLFYLLGITAGCLLPLLYIHQQYHRWNPFALNGKKFLVFYGLALLLCHALRMLERSTVPGHSRPHFRSSVLPLAVLITGLARLAQGIYHTRPVGFLILLLLFHLVLLLFLKGQALKPKS